MSRILSAKGRGLGCVASRMSVRLGLVALLMGATLPSQALQDSDRQIAADMTVSQNQACTGISNFSWEIGDKSGRLWGGMGGGGAGTGPTATQQIPIYSAGKWIWGAYAYERLGGVLSPADLRSVKMTAGYKGTSSLNQCTLYVSVEACRAGMAAKGTAPLDSFSYDSAHFQNQAVETFGTLTSNPSLKLMNNAKLADEIHRVLGNDFILTYNSPHLAGGAKSSVTEYAKFLRKILNAQLRVGSALGASPVCTYTGATNATTGRQRCATATYSPASDPYTGMDEQWDYSIGHWVETDPVNNVNDHAYSSAGAGGFYPWIDASKTYYGIVARNLSTLTSAGESMRCGRKIRKAWITGSPQLQ